MYATTEGFRVLLGYERDIFCLAVRILADLIYHMQDDICTLTGLESFDELTTLQKLNMLYIATKALLDEKYPAPEKTAVLDVTIVVIYQSLKTLVDYEISSGDEQVRNLLDIACVLYPGQYYKKIDELQYRVLEDDDWELTALQDEHPELAKMHRIRLGINDNYFTEIASDEGDAEQIYESIISMCGDFNA